jgi:hypothetical protein
MLMELVHDRVQRRALVLAVSVDPSFLFCCHSDTFKRHTCYAVIEIGERTVYTAQ